jgi:hypothetical protein
MKLIHANHRGGVVRILPKSPERMKVKVGDDLEVVITSREDGSATVSMYHKSSITEKTFYNN